MSSKQADFLMKLRDAGQMIADAATELLKSITSQEPELENAPAAVKETTFTTLK